MPVRRQCAQIHCICLTDDTVALVEERSITRAAKRELIAVEGVRLERHIYLILPSVGETSPAARRFADQLLRIHPGGQLTGPVSRRSPVDRQRRGRRCAHAATICDRHHPRREDPECRPQRTGSRGCSVGAGDLSGLPDRDGAGEDDNQDAGDPAAVVWQNCPHRHSPPYLAPLRPSLTPLAAGTTWPGHRASPGLGHHYHYWRILTGGKSAAR